MNRFDTDGKRQYIVNLVGRYKAIMSKISALRAEGKTIYPKDHEVLNAFKYLKNFEDIKVVIVGQDPYHSPNQANGMAFSVRGGVPPPPSLLNIFKELESDLGMQLPVHGDLSSWAKQGVLLLNRVLTVEAGKAKSHSNMGWEEYTKDLLEYINQNCDNVIFLLWGADACKLKGMVTNPANAVLTATHPSPLSAHKGFFGCRHFSRANEFLISHGRSPINWSI